MGLFIFMKGDKIMNNKEILKAVGLLKYALEMVGDGGTDPFNNSEYVLMYKFLNQIEEEYKMESNILKKVQKIYDESYTGMEFEVRLNELIEEYK